MFNQGLRQQIRDVTVVLTKRIKHLKDKAESPNTPPEEREKASGVIRDLQARLKEMPGEITESLQP